MRFVSITRLRVRSVRFLPSFALHTLQSLTQVKKSPGFKSGSLLVDRQWTFWTMTAWDCEASMRAYMTNGSHRTAMPHLLDWCDEASLVHWDQAEEALPSWEAADRKMRETGRTSRVRHPSPNQAGMNYPAPRVVIVGPLRSANVTS